MNHFCKKEAENKCKSDSRNWQSKYTSIRTRLSATVANAQRCLDDIYELRLRLHIALYQRLHIDWAELLKRLLDFF